jgi:hypothetical protein
MKAKVALAVVMLGLCNAIASLEVNLAGTKEYLDRMPMLVYASKYGRGLIDFDIYYREIPPFNPGTFMKVGLCNSKGETLFHCVVDSTEYIKKNVCKVRLTIHESYLAQGYLEICTHWPKQNEIVNQTFSLKDLFEWNNQFDNQTIELHALKLGLDKKDERFEGLLERKKLSYKQWKESIDKLQYNPPPRGAEGVGGSESSDDTGSAD